MGEAWIIDAVRTAKAIRNGTYTPERPGLMPRTDGPCLLYPGRVHSLHGESESGKSLVAQAEAARDSLYRQTELDVWQSYYDLQTAAGGTTSTEAQVKSAEQTAQATLARYQAGFGSILDLITAQQDESNARVQRIQSYLDWYTALARLNYSIGMNNILAATSEKK